MFINLAETVSIHVYNNNIVSLFFNLTRLRYFNITSSGSQTCKYYLGNNIYFSTHKLSVSVRVVLPELPTQRNHYINNYILESFIVTSNLQFNSPGHSRWYLG